MQGPGGWGRGVWEGAGAPAGHSRTAQTHHASPSSAHTSGWVSSCQGQFNVDAIDVFPKGRGKGTPRPLCTPDRGDPASPSTERGLVLLFTVRNDVDKVFVVQVARNVRREGCEHLIDLPGNKRVEKAAQKGFVAGGLSGWRAQEAGGGWEGARTSSWENLSPCVISISLMLQTREHGEHQGGLGEDTPLPPVEAPLTH